MPPKGKYTDPKLREEVKEELKESDKGGAPGQWSARKAQMMAQEYKRRGGDYTTDKSDKDENQKNLSKWTDEEWQTKEGSGNAKKEDGTQKRYLPKKAWENMSEKEKKETDKKKQEGGKEGKQYVDNTDKAKNERKKASSKKGDNKSSNGKDTKKGEDDDESKASKKDHDNGDGSGDDEDVKETQVKGNDKANENGDASSDKDENRRTTRSGQKRKSSHQEKDHSKKSKTSSESNANGKSKNGTIGSKHMPDEEPGKPGSNDRLPKKGQAITWRAMPGYVEGEVVEVLTQGKKVDRKNVKASDSDPKIVMKSASSGKICVHKPDACYYD